MTSAATMDRDEKLGRRLHLLHEGGGGSVGGSSVSGSSGGGGLVGGSGGLRAAVRRGVAARVLQL